MSFLRTVPPYSHQADVWMEFLKHFNYLKVIFIHSSDPDGRALLGRFQSTSQNLGDDTETKVQVCYSFYKSPIFAYRAVQTHFNELKKCSAMWKIQINTEKSSAIMLSKRRFLDLPKLKFCNFDIDYVCECRYLGVTLERRLNWKTHCDLMKEKAFSAFSKCFSLLKSTLSLISIPIKLIFGHL